MSHYFYPDVGGIETNSEILASSFYKMGAEVHVATWTRYNGKPKFPFKVVRSPGILKLVNEHKWADVVLENNPSLRLSWPNLFIRKPLVIALNTWTTRLNGEKGFRDKLKRLWFRRAKNIIAVSDAIRKKEWAAAVVIENSYNNHLFKVHPGIIKTTPFVFLGRLVSDKGADQAIEAVASLIKQGLLGNSDEVQLTIIGEGPERHRLQILSKRLGVEKNIEFTGTLRGETLVECLNMHRFIIVPSAWEEPYGNVVLEAMACGCIPIASNGGGLPEAVGQAGFLFERNNSGCLLNILKTLLNDGSKAEAAFKNRDRHLAEHSMELVSERYFKILQDALN